MAKERNLRIGAYLVAAVLLGAPAIRASFAEEVTHHAPDSAASGQLSPPGTSMPALSSEPEAGATKPEDHASAKAGDTPASADGGAAPNVQSGAEKGKETTVEHPQGDAVTGARSGAAATEPNALNTHVEALGPIDTRISVQPRRRGEKPDKARQAKINIRSGAPANLHARPTLVPGAVGRISRNAIGLSVPPPNGAAGRDAVPAGSRVAVESPAVGASGIAGPNGKPIVTAPVAARGTINGSRATHRGFAPAMIGGWTKTVAGINGSMIRPKH